RGIAPHPREDRAPHEDALVAGRDAGPARPEADRALDHAVPHAVGIEPEVETAADRARIRERIGDGPRIARGHAGVGVEEEEDVAAGAVRAGVHLACATWWLGEHAVGEGALLVERRDDHRNRRRRLQHCNPYTRTV